MRNTKFLSLGLALMGVLFFSTVKAQQPQGQSGQNKNAKMQKKGPHGPSGPMKAIMKDLSDNQKKEMKAVKTKFAKETNPLKAQLGIVKANKKAEMVAENPSLDKINSYIDEIMKIKTSLAKKKAAQHLEIRKILTPDQRALYDEKILQRQRR